MSKLRGQYNDRRLGGSLEDLVPLVILAFGHNGYLGSDSIKWIGDLTNAVLVDSFSLGVGGDIETVRTH